MELLDILDQDENGSAIADLTEVIERNSSNAKAYNNRGIAYREKGKDIFMDILTESELSRFLTYDNEHDLAFISAYRTSRDYVGGKRYTKRENLQRSSNLLAKLVTKGYGLASVLGQFRGGGQDSSERTFFVVNFPDDERFIQNIISYGEYFEQDTVLIIPKGALQGGGKSRAYYVRTNECENNFLRLLNIKKKFFGRTLINREIKAFFTRAGGSGRNFSFDPLEDIKVVTEHRNTGSIMSRGMIAQQAMKDWEETKISFPGFPYPYESQRADKIFYLAPQGIPDHVDRDDVNSFVERVIGEFGGRELYRLMGAKGEYYGVDWYGNYWIVMPMEKGATNGAFYCHITYHENDDTYTLRFLRDSIKDENCFLVISEYIGLNLYDLKSLYQEQTGSYVLYD